MDWLGFRALSSNRIVDLSRGCVARLLYGEGIFSPIVVLTAADRVGGDFEVSVNVSFVLQWLK